MAPDGRWAGSWGHMVLRTLGIPGQGSKKDFPILENASGRFPVTGLGAPDLPPVLVAFADETRKASVYRVLPTDFDARLGADVVWGGMEFEFTNDPVTDNLASRLPMLTKSDQNNKFPKDPPGQLRPISEQPFEYKVDHNEFFSGKRGFP